MISVKGLSAKVGTFSLHDINFNIEKKECLTIIGPNGCGKTTLIECIAGLHNSKGNILIDNVDVASLPPEKRKVGYVPQDFVLFPNMTTDQNIGFGIVDEKENRIEKIGQVMHLLEIENLKGRNVKTLSGGEKQKVALARALAINPKVLLLDEPFSLLDPLAKEKLRKDLKKIIEKILTSLEVPVIYVSHDLSDAMASDKIAVMNNGKMEQVGLRSEVLDNPKSVFVAEYFGFNVLDGVVSSANGDSINIQIEDKIIQACKMQLAEGEKVTVVLKPQDIIVSIDKEIPLLKWRKCQCNTLQGYVTEINNTGPMARLIIDVGFPLKMDKSIHVLDDLELNVGREVFVHFTSHTTKVIPN